MSLGRRRPAPGSRAELWRELHARHPRFRDAVAADARLTSLFRGEEWAPRSRLDAVLRASRLAWESDAFLAQVAYRAKARLQSRGVPVLPRLMHRLAMAAAQVSIGDPVLVHPGVYLIHGQVVLDGLVEIRSGTTIAPWVTIGLRAGDVHGPTIEEDVAIGTGAKIVGNVRIGAGATVGANAVVVDDVPPGA